MGERMSRRRDRSRVFFLSTIAVACALTAWALVTACSSSSSPSAAAVDGGMLGDEPTAERPLEDAGAPDVSPDTVGAPCDPVKQDCADPALRCQIINAGNQYVTGCEPPWEPAKNKEGEICSRQKAGIDDCVRGFSCLLDGVTATSCHRLCAQDSDCGPGARCGAITTVAPYYGLCWKTCTPFGSDCAGATCAGVHFDNDGTNEFEACREIGSNGIGTSCQAQFDCQPDMNCQGNGGFKCKAMCDDAHPCDGGTCTKSVGLPSDGGVCQ
jgi:hypothetical protein